jgi:hypothetical protein
MSKLVSSPIEAEKSKLRCRIRLCSGRYAAHARRELVNDRGCEITSAERGRSSAQLHVCEGTCVAVGRTSCAAIESIDHAGDRVRRFLDIDRGGSHDAANPATVSEPVLRCRRFSCRQRRDRSFQGNRRPPQARSGRKLDNSQAPPVVAPRGLHIWPSSWSWAEPERSSTPARFRVRLDRLRRRSCAKQPASRPPPCRRPRPRNGADGFPIG